MTRDEFLKKHRPPLGNKGARAARAAMTADLDAVVAAYPRTRSLVIELVNALNGAAQALGLESQGLIEDPSSAALPLKKLERELTLWRNDAEAILATLPPDAVVRVREGGGSENLRATLAVSVSAALRKGRP